jgi:hypothetical protein
MPHYVIVKRAGAKFMFFIVVTQYIGKFAVITLKEDFQYRCFKPTE